MDEPKLAPPPLPPHKVANEHAALLRKHEARRNLMIIVIAALAGGGLFWYLKATSALPFADLSSFENAVGNEVAQIGESSSSLPAPLVSSSKAGRISAKDAVLTRAGIIADTNGQRAANGDLPPLAENTQLDDIATIRLEDMFTNQYFAHVSPIGQSAESVASSVGYSHIALGENLAEGFYAGDSGVVTAWMNSPGHRANILDSHYTEIGVAARLGTMNGQQTWIAVQVFGKPTSACPPAPDPNLPAALNAAEAQIASTSAELAQMKSDIDSMQPQSGDAYNQKVSQYNAMVDQYNTLVAQTKTQVTQYNDAVQAYNSCL